ncbi:LPS-assembly lipoprotein LptE [Sinimarinibacterium sp. CAU 1509]|uniref:LPS-assembly lipoprotein LptE n=1 Tax=Sinimarinibacterium sp. CAU 1509 TaxID=2562283 RepID=UPI00200A4150|nr:LPS assembly lipoprotein LptE [Sinimarinibacterium sp. CAU 1509]
MSLRLAACCLAALLLSGCGFRLAGTRPLPETLRDVYIEVITPYQVVPPPLESSLRSILQRRGATVRGSAGAGTTIIRLSDLNERREVLSIGIDGKALEYRLVTSVRYAAYAGGRVLAGPDELRLTRDYSFQPAQVLAKEAEEARLREFIQTQLAELMMLRLETQASHREEGAALAADAPADAAH